MGQSHKQLFPHISITNSGRPVGDFPLFKIAEDGKAFLFLKQIEVSDSGNAEPIYKAFAEIITGNVVTIKIGRAILYLSRRKIHLEFYEEPKE
jgi:hypothetical protein